MSQHHPDTPQENGDSNPVKIAIYVSIGALALIIGIFLLASFAVGTHSLGMDAKASSPEETAKRIAPVAKLAVEGSGAPAASAPPVAAPATKTAVLAVTAAAIPAATPGAKADGKAVYATACSVCHTAGIAGAPKLGDKGGWAPRVKAGMDTLYASALKGKGSMPAKGGNTALADADVKAAVDYMLAQSK